MTNEYEFTEEDDVLASDDKETMGLFSPFKILVVAFDGVLEKQVSCKLNKSA